MKEESGRSMVEIVGVLAIGVIMIAAAFSMYRSIDQRQKRLIASETIEDVAKKTKILYEFSSYKNVSIEDLYNKKAISDMRAPIGTSWALKAENDFSEFSITLSGLSASECKYFKTKKSDWAYTKKDYCSANPAYITFYVK